MTTTLPRTPELYKWNHENTYYTQTNNPTEEIKRKSGLKGFLESCGPTAIVNLIAAAQGESAVEVICPGIYKPQPEEILTDYFNDPRNYKDLQKIRTDIKVKDSFGNRYPQLYELAVHEVFGVRCTFGWGVGLKDVIGALRSNKGIMICLKKPGHYIGIVKIDPVSQLVTYRDPWPGNYWPKNLKGTSGFNREIFWADLEKNLKGFRLVVG